ncbi:hypothetical protein ASA1KI_09810 [Opitutales bacterium ASA1]|uniref:hypothetical protein n=1 Tax=Congregicoccus parvus TaxID=3081749 RepID=UPI002B2DE773|nr:hypothetical protein ASA1KI_09810 [Opitutales bacterium ASA1]
MKQATVWGGFLGFVLAISAGYFVGREPVMLMLDACLGAAFGGWLFQWWQRLLLTEVRTAVSARMANLPGEEASAQTEGKHTPDR